MNPVTKASQLRSFHFFPKDTKGNVRDCTGKDSTPNRLLMETDRSICELGPKKTSNETGSFLIRDRVVSEVGSDDIERKKKVWASIRNGPAAILEMSALEKAEETLSRLRHRRVKILHFFEARASRRASVCLRNRSRVGARNSVSEFLL